MVTGAMVSTHGSDWLFLLAAAVVPMLLVHIRGAIARVQERRERR